MERNDLKNFYIESAERFRKLESAEDRILLILSVLRLLCFAGGLAGVIIAFMKSSALGMVALAILTFVFLNLLRLYGLHSEKKGIQS